MQNNDKALAQTTEATPHNLDSMPVKEVQRAVDALFAYLRNILYSPKEAQLDINDLPEEFKQLGEGMLFIGACVNESRNLANDLAKGNLNSTQELSRDNEIASGLKNLHSTLKHISWQVKQVALGNYDQHLSFAGEFSEAINNMIAQLKERDDVMRSEIELNKQIAIQSRNTMLLLEGITKSIAEWIIVIDTTSFEWLYTNHGAANYLPNKESVEELKSILNYKIEDYNKQISQGTLKQGEPLQSLIELMGEDGSLSQFFSVMGYPLSWMESTSLVVILTDTTDEQHKRQQLERAAYYDELTHSYSRHYGMQQLERWVKEGQTFVIAFVDMDGLKYVNDTYGHAAGDEYILATSQKLSEFSNDVILCRLGGDEFMLLIRFVSSGMTILKLEQMRNELAQNFDGAYERSFSFGVVEVDHGDKRSASLLLSIADESMYEDKRKRKKERRAQV